MRFHQLTCCKILFTSRSLLRLTLLNQCFSLKPVLTRLRCFISVVLCDTSPFFPVFYLLKAYVRHPIQSGYYFFFEVQITRKIKSRAVQLNMYTPGFSSSVRDQSLCNLCLDVASIKYLIVMVLSSSWRNRSVYPKINFSTQ